MTKTSNSTEQRARQAGQHRAERKRLQLHAVDRDADRFGRDLGLAHGVDRAPPAPGQQIIGQQLDDQCQPGAHPEVQHLPGQRRPVRAERSEFSQCAHGRAEPFGARNVADARRPIGHGDPGLRDHERHDRQGDGDHGQVVTARAQRRQRDEKTNHASDRSREKDGDPYRHAGARGQQCRRVRAEGEQRAVTQRHLALVADQHV
jgi:hypothetical protein